ncbi:Rha family transcriptional regulator [Arsenophonus nasoniae]|uniref:Phage regulatory protein Rha (Phage_pRha) n=1 Tax=Arsenophonus nasoniae TaxID=638 RepID=A0A4P7KPX7_9GAMM|nr:Rha family transcriptional regulator [Arsenophonus nasoniae]QBY41911.1 Phage regulatory protein Rha (Phage_pRha) [Arsenophonus nasoniae]WGM06124.1 Rha family transcriptional regulator [Arsenophonus nasoniae]WGM11086.1 Rha family transcriptional regulator [Arsenophonus nasoniae]WGM15787.1 Rha family transcriptional regulator [Arsenophonus nasoniae]
MTLQLSTITPKVTIHNGKAITTTDDVAHYFGKQHHHVVQKVESLECSEEFITRNFSRMIKNVQLAKGATREVVYYEMTKDGFVFLVMGFTGKKAAAFKEAYIAEFNRMEAELHSAPKYQPQTEAHEKFSSKDTQNLARIIALMTQNFRFKQAWNNAIWYALREVTGIPSPYPMEVRLVPSIASECERIWHVTEELQDVIADAEKTAIKRIIRKRENADKVIDEIETLLSQTTQDNQLMLNGALSNWHKAELTHFLQRC